MSTKPRPQSPPARKIRQDEEVQKALAQAAPGAEESIPSGRRRGLLWAAIWAACLLVSAVLLVLLDQRIIEVPGGSFNLLRRVSLALVIFFGAIFSEYAIEHFLVSRLESAVARYNLTRILRLVAALAVLGVLASILYGNILTGLVSLGVISIIVGLAVQTPMTSFIGWLYILIRAPYRVGDRIQIGNATGDVIEVSYLDTTLWEFGGKYLSSDHPSGRIIKFPNSNVLNTAVYNYSWPLFPYIWNEIKLQVGYESDLEFISETMLEVAESEIGAEMQNRVRVYRDLLAKTPVDELTVQEKPVVLFRASENTWLEAVLRYLVDPKRAGRVKTALLRKLLARLNAAPDKVLFPKGPNR
jgi:small-conductance mechanosensitive channel